MLIKLYCKALTQTSTSFNSSICIDFILRWEKYLLPEVINSLMHFLMKQDTPTNYSFLVSLPCSAKGSDFPLGEKHIEEIRFTLLRLG